MSKRKHKDDCCCNSCCPCCCSMNPYYMNNYGMNNGFFGSFGGNNACGQGAWDNGILEAIVFWLIACGAGLLNTNSILIILLFILYGWACDNGGSGLFGL